MQTDKLSGHPGILTLYWILIFSVLRMLQTGLGAGSGYSSVFTGITSHLLRFAFTIARASSYQLQDPSFE